MPVTAETLCVFLTSKMSVNVQNFNGSPRPRTVGQLVKIILLKGLLFFSVSEKRLQLLG